jgi:hypothetical protein
MGVLHNCVATKEKKKKTERSITPSTHTASKKTALLLNNNIKMSPGVP